MICSPSWDEIQQVIPREVLRDSIAHKIVPVPLAYREGYGYTHLGNQVMQHKCV
jgi:hypothetical protein